MCVCVCECGTTEPVRRYFIIPSNIRAPRRTEKRVKGAEVKKNQTRGKQEEAVSSWRYSARRAASHTAVSANGVGWAHQGRFVLLIIAPQWSDPRLF